MPKKISVIIPCYNVQKEIDRCVNSLVRQTVGVENLELIFVDDASTDNTLTRLKQWEKRFPDSVTVIACKKNGRQGTARNIGMGYATAPYIGFADADDWVDVTMYEKLLGKAEKTKAQVTSCRMAWQLGDGKMHSIECVEYKGKTGELFVVDSVNARREFLQNGLPSGVYTKLYRRDFLRENKITFPEKLIYEDNYFATLVSYTLTTAYVIDEALYFHYGNFEGTVAKKNDMRQFDRLQIELMKLKELKRRGFEADFHEEIYADFLKMYYINTLHLAFTRFDTLPYDMLNGMRETMLKEFPDYRESVAYKRLTWLEKEFLTTLETKMQKQNWDNLAERYRLLVEENAKHAQKTVRNRVSQRTSAPRKFLKESLRDS